LEELKLKQADKKLRRKKSNWLQHVTRMNNRMPKTTDHIYIDKKLTDIGWPTKIVLPSIFANKH